MKMVCVDDEPQFYEQVREIVSQCREEGGNVELLFYDRPEMLQYDLSEQKFYDLYLLDIEFTGSMSGLALAELIREKDQAAQILFVTSHAEYALAGYDYHPLHYILKSQMEEKLKQVLDEIVREQSDQAAQFRIFRKHSRIEKIAYREICYIYKDGKNSIYVCGDGRTYAERKPLAQIRQEIRAPQMLAIGKSYIVNLNRIERLEGPGFDQVTQHSQALGVLTGALSAQEGRRAMLYALSGEEVLPCTFPWQYTLFRALDAVGLYDRTAPIWDQYFEMLDRNLTTVPERPGETRSDCHAWSALPLYEVPRMLLGVQPAAPGWARIRVEPHAVGLDRLSGTVPTPRGPVTVRWEKTAGGALCAAVEGPKDVPLELVANGKTVLAVQGCAKIGGEEA